MRILSKILSVALLLYVPTIVQTTPPSDKKAKFITVSLKLEAIAYVYDIYILLPLEARKILHAQGFKNLPRYNEDLPKHVDFIQQYLMAKKARLRKCFSEQELLKMEDRINKKADKRAAKGWIF